ncbi:uncharacterized protein LOC117110357 isoform X3 [Anneissia japonica]|uniref:uncharacterized protein LOC117110357 isoform X2 n=1 Tax=Anneissia japonica TaxID=1529436 RepID=UPI0014256A76|nr:uncharacterized protein LOC117110357 isoform X2 [Anneissia japonica]XP_033108957.1 uncharacterized protein LOC117110357 isoform X3 [Anneissia japonica]
MTASRCETRFGWCLIISVIYGYRIFVFAVTSIHPLSLDVFTQENAVFNCEVVDTSTAHMWQWFKDDYEKPKLIVNEGSYTQNGYEFVLRNTRQASSLTILNTTIEDNQSRYYCQFGSKSKTATLTVIDGSRLDPIYPECEADIATVNTKKTVKMTCGASGGNPRPSLQWYRNGVTMEHDDLTNMGDNNSYFNVSTRLLTVEDEEAVFMCKAEGLAATLNQTCYIDIRVSPTVMIISSTTSFNTGDSLKFTCLAMTPWNITDYIWTVNNQLMATSNSFYNVTDDKTTLIMNNLQSDDADTEIKCEAVTTSGLTGSNTVIISLINESNIFKIVAIVIGGLIFLTLICLILFILIRRRRLQEKPPYDKPVVLAKPSYREHSADAIVHSLPLENPTFVNEINLSYYSNGIHLTRPVSDNYDTKVDIHGVAENDPKMETPRGFETYANTGSIASLRSFCSFNSFDDDEVEVQNQLYVQSFKSKQSHVSSSRNGKLNFGNLYAKPVDRKHNPDTQSNNGIANFGDSYYAKPIKDKQNPDTRSIDGIADFGDLYAKPIKHRQSIHQSLENILGSTKNVNTSSNRSDSVDDLYSKPNKKRVTASSEHLPQLYAKPDRTHKKASEVRPITYPGGTKI